MPMNERMTLFCPAKPFSSWASSLSVSASRTPSRPCSRIPCITQPWFGRMGQTSPTHSKATQQQQCPIATSPASRECARDRGSFRAASFGSMGQTSPNNSQATQPHQC